jgi:hypothetical protein
MVHEDSANRRLASQLIEHIGDLGLTVAAFRIGPQAEGGWELVALDHQTGESWRVEADDPLDAAAELAIMVGVELKE